MAQWVKGFSCTYEDLCWNPQSPHKHRPGSRLPIIPVLSGQNRKWRKDYLRWLMDQSARCPEEQHRNPVSNKVEYRDTRGCDLTLTFTLWHTCALVLTHTHMHAHTNQSYVLPHAEEACTPNRGIWLTSAMKRKMFWLQWRFHWADANEISKPFGSCGMRGSSGPLPAPGFIAV